jgi:hypothetical protein
MYQDYIAPIRRHEFVDQSLRLGRKISSAASDHLILEASNRWQLTAWFGNGLVGMVELFDAESGGDVRFQFTGTLPAPGDVPGILRSSK